MERLRRGGVSPRVFAHPILSLQNRDSSMREKKATTQQKQITTTDTNELRETYDA